MYITDLKNCKDGQLLTLKKVKNLITKMFRSKTFFSYYDVHDILHMPERVRESTSPVSFLDLYFDLFSYPVAPIVSSAGGIVN